jgi:N-acetylneuraminic acid mutarotase
MQGPCLAAARRLLSAGLVLAAPTLFATACGDAGVTPTPVQPSAAPSAAPGTWTTLAPMLQPRSEMAIAELDGKVYVIGGYPPGRIPSNVVQVYDPASNSWTLGPPTPVPLHHSHAVAVGDRLFLIGGEFDGAGTGRPPVYLDTTYELDVAAGAWRSRAPMPTARSGGGLGVIAGKIYVAGGRPPRGNDFAVYDPAADLWTVLPALPTARNHLAVDAIGGRLYVAGGRFEDVGGPMTAVLEVFDPVSGAWTAEAPLPSPRAGVTAVAAFGCLYVIAGEGNVADPQGMFHQAEAYDPRTNTWHSLSHMPTATHGLTRAALLDGRIHIPGGSTTLGGNNGTTLHQVYRPERRCDQ